MFMQPIIDLATGGVQKFEALARLKDGDGRIVRPRNLLSTLGETELETLFKRGLDIGLNWLSRWHGEGHDFGLSINLAPATLRRPEVTRWIIELLDSHSIEPHRLTVELLENQDIEEIRNNESFNSLLARGVKLSIDDMGAGYSSLRRILSPSF
ncbi:Diguanylate phosphodiesterase, predicted domain protein [mine drainage metagenome]|uniref:Diguanylate phosphodiesterase, predicted domain protein n=1 Tax=mine drainage metagenome TaxID=410659 RepID=T1B6N1_9ZZZZ